MFCLNLFILDPGFTDLYDELQFMKLASKGILVDSFEIIYFN